jgi:hypothetical protein
MFASRIVIIHACYEGIYCGTVSYVSLPRLPGGRARGGYADYVMRFDPTPGPGACESILSIVSIRFTSGSVIVLASVSTILQIGSSSLGPRLRQFGLWTAEPDILAKGELRG